MEPSTAFRPLLFDRARRCLLAAAGMLLFSFANCLQLQACIGLSPWFSLNDGLANTFPITYGQASILVSALIITLDILLRAPIGVCTILNALVVGTTSDIYLALGLVPEQTFLPIQLLCLLAGMVTMCFAQFLYMKVGLSCGPRDSLMVAVGKRFPKVSIGKVNIALFAIVQVIALFMGGPFGIGTFIVVFGNGMVMDAVFRLLRFEPRSIQHENLLQTFAALRDAARR